MFRLLIYMILFGVLVTFGATAAPPPQTVLANLPNVSFPAPHQVAAGALTASDIAALKRAGIREVIDVRAASETPGFDGATAVRNAGIAYRNLPIHGDRVASVTVRGPAASRASAAGRH